MARSSVLAAVAAVALLACGCSSDGAPYEALSEEAMQYVIPESAGWSTGELCPGDADCSGPITPAVIEGYDWYRIGDLRVGSNESPSATVTATLGVEEARSATGAEVDDLRVQVWGPDIDNVIDVLDDGVEIWAGVDPEINYVVVFVAFDADGRLAGIGNAAAEYFTVPVAELAADAEARSGFAYLDPLMTT